MDAAKASAKQTLIQVRQARQNFNRELENLRIFPCDRYEDICLQVGMIIESVIMPEEERANQILGIATEVKSPKCDVIVRNTKKHPKSKKKTTSRH